MRRRREIERSAKISQSIFAKKNLSKKNESRYFRWNSGAISSQQQQQLGCGGMCTTVNYNLHLAPPPAFLTLAASSESHSFLRVPAPLPRRHPSMVRLSIFYGSHGVFSSALLSACVLPLGGIIIPDLYIDSTFLHCVDFSSTVFEFLDHFPVRPWIFTALAGSRGARSLACLLGSSTICRVYG